MPHDPDEPRRYSDEETALILRRAAELQEPGGNSRPAAGFTLAEIQQIAAEAGIDPACVTEATALISVQEPDRWARIVGAPTRFRYERTVSGELPDPAWAALVQEIRQAMRKPGQVSHLPGALEWVDEGENGDLVRVGVTSGAGKTRVELRAQRANEASMFLILSPTAGVVLATLAGALLGLDPGPELWTVMGGGASGGLAIGWAGWKRFSARWERRLSGLVTRLARAAEEASGSTQEHAGPPPPAHRSEPPV